MHGHSSYRATRISRQKPSKPALRETLETLQALFREEPALADVRGLEDAAATPERRERLQSLLQAAHQQLSALLPVVIERDPDKRAVVLRTLDSLAAGLSILEFLPPYRVERLYSDDERDQAFARLQTIDQELALLGQDDDRYAVLQSERLDIAIELDRSLTRLGPYPPWTRLLAAERADAEEHTPHGQPQRTSGRTVLPLEIVRDVVLRGLVTYFRSRRGAPLPKQWQLCGEISDSRLRGGKVHAKTLSRWLSDHGSSYASMLLELEPEARRRALIGSSRDTLASVQPTSR